MKPTSPPSWLKNLQEIITRRRPTDRPFRLAVVGVGHELRGDDAVGLAVVRRLRAQIPPARAIAPSSTIEWLILDGGPAPESQSGALRRFQPDLVILADAAQMDAPPGAVAWLDLAAIDGLSAATHILPLNMLTRYLTHELSCEVGLLGIQPAQTDLLEGLSGEVEKAVAGIVHNLLRGDW